MLIMAISAELRASRFWETRSLVEMTPEQWEAVCDRCGKCCLIKLQNEEDDSIHFTNVACRYLDYKACQCRAYEQRKLKVPECIVLTPEGMSQIRWLPTTCAYRVLAEGKDLPAYHPLVSGDENSMIAAGATVSGRIFSEKDVHPDDLEDFIINWVSLD